MKGTGQWLLLGGMLAVGTAVLAAADDPGPVVELPPMVVEASATQPPWLYARADDAEYLSRCSMATTRGYVQMRRDRLQWLHVLFPEQLFLRMDVPAVTLLLSQTLKPSGNAEVIGEVMEMRNRGDSSRGYSRATTAPNMMLNDSDAVGVFAYIDEANFKRTSLTVSTDYVRFLLEGRRPALPQWLQEGMVAVYNSVAFTAQPITLRPLVWGTPTESRGLTKDPEAPRTLLSAGELFSDSLARPRWSPRGEIAHTQSELLVRWALDPRNGVREAFWRFAVRACEENVTEKMFESCFGFGFADLRDRLSDYLPTAVKSPLQIPLGKLPATPPLEIRPATPSEIARLRGEWERLSVSMVRRRYPEHAVRYLELARRTLQRAYEAGERDPRLLATRGLCEIDAGDDADAREFLDQAVANHVVRPRAYYELARLQWIDRVRGQPATREFSAEEIAPIVETLRLGSAQTPRLAESAGLLADVWMRCSTAPPDGDLKELARLGRQFVAEPRVCLRVARTLGHHGKSADAVALLAEGFPHVNDDATRTQFAQIYAALTKAH